VAKKFFEKKIRYSFLWCKFEKEASKKGKTCQSFETKSIGPDITNQRPISVLSLDNETVRIQYEVMWA
jgi:hypothetical protein